jgi:hypothetical protein
VIAITGNARRSEKDGHRGQAAWQARQPGRIQRNEQERITMNTKQQFATGFLAMVIVASVAFMPVNAEVKDSVKARQSGMIVMPLNTAELPQEQVRDLTYN